MNPSQMERELDKLMFGSPATTEPGSPAVPQHVDDMGSTGGQSEELRAECNTGNPFQCKIEPAKDANNTTSAFDVSAVDARSRSPVPIISDTDSDSDYERKRGKRQQGAEYELSGRMSGT